jgi:hypothetical protein
LKTLNSESKENLKTEPKTKTPIKTEETENKTKSR